MKGQEGPDVESFGSVDNVITSSATQLFQGKPAQIIQEQMSVMAVHDTSFTQTGR